MITYRPLWNTLKEKKISQYSLINDYHVSAGQLSRLRSNQNVSSHTINQLCAILDCKVQDIMQYHPDSDSKN